MHPYMLGYMKTAQDPFNYRGVPVVGDALDSWVQSRYNEDPKGFISKAFPTIQKDPDYIKFQRIYPQAKEWKTWADVQNVEISPKEVAQYAVNNPGEALENIFGGSGGSGVKPTYHGGLSIPIRTMIEGKVKERMNDSNQRAALINKAVSEKVAAIKKFLMDNKGWVAAGLGLPLLFLLGRNLMGGRGEQPQFQQQQSRRVVNPMGRFI